MARRSSKAHMAWVRSFRKKGRSASAAPRRRRRTTRRRARRNAWPVAGLALNAPRRRRRSHARRNPVARRRYRRNPSLSLGGLVALPPLKQVLFAGVGFAGTPVVEGFVNQFVPASISANTFGKYAVKIASMVGLAWAVKKVVGQEEGRMVAIGGGAYILTSAVAEFAPGVIPGLSAYVQPTMNAYVTGNQPNYTGMGALPSSAFGGSLVAGANPSTRFNRFA